MTDGGSASNASEQERAPNANDPLLLRIGTEVRDPKGMTLKASDGDWSAIKRLLLAGADATIADHQGFTALQIA